jgi:hypothetical protein
MKCSAIGSLWVTVAVLAAGVALEGCKERKLEPVPPPQSQPGSSVTPETSRKDPHCHRSRGIYWFQGGIEEAFSANLPDPTPIFRY